MSKKTWLIALSAVTAVGAFACGDESTDTGSGTDAAVVNHDGGLDSGAGACMTTQFGSGASCTVDGGAGIQLCTNNVPTGACQSVTSLIAGFLGDSGLTGLTGDGGPLSGFDAGFTVGDGGSIMYGDATINLEAGTLKCPSPLVCSDIGKQLAPLAQLAGLTIPPISGCAESASATPPTCPTAGAACTIGAASGGMCTNLLIGTYCIIPCN